MRHDYFKIVMKFRDGSFSFIKCSYLAVLRFELKEFPAAKLFGNIVSAKIFNISRNNELYAALS